MDCWHCRRTAVGACRFCGRGICEDHVETLPYVLELYRGGDVTRANTGGKGRAHGPCDTASAPV